MMAYQTCERRTPAPQRAALRCDVHALRRAIRTKSDVSSLHSPSFSWDPTRHPISSSVMDESSHPNGARDTRQLSAALRACPMLRTHITLLKREGISPSRLHDNSIGPGPYRIGRVSSAECAILERKGGMKLSIDGHANYGEIVRPLRIQLRPNGYQASLILYINSALARQPVNRLQPDFEVNGSCGKCQRATQNPPSPLHFSSTRDTAPRPFAESFGRPQTIRGGFALLSVSWHATGAGNLGLSLH